MRKRLSADALEYFRAEGSRGGKIGGKRAAEKMTAAQRSARARKGGQAAALARKARARKTK